MNWRSWHSWKYSYIRIMFSGRCWSLMEVEEEFVTRLIMFCFVWLFLYIRCCSGDFSYSKMVIYDSRHIPIFVGSFLELQKMWPNIDPRSPYLLQKYCKTYMKIWKHLRKHIMFVNIGIWVFDICWKPMYRHFWKMKINRSKTQQHTNKNTNTDINITNKTDGPKQ